MPGNHTISNSPRRDPFCHRFPAPMLNLFVCVEFWIVGGLRFFGKNTPLLYHFSPRRQLFFIQNPACSVWNRRGLCDGSDQSPNFSFSFSKSSATASASSGVSSTYFSAHLLTSEKYSSLVKRIMQSTSAAG